MNEYQLRNLFENMVDGVLVADPTSGRFRMANHAVCQLTGYDADELCQLSVKDIHSAEALSAVMEDFRRLARGIAYSAMNVPVQRKDGEVCYVDITASVADFEGETLLVGLFRDATDRRRLEADIRRATEELDRYFTRSLDLLSIADMDKRFLRLNPEWERVLGYPVGELVGTSLVDWVHPEDRAATVDALSRLSGREAVLEFTNRCRHRDGTWRWLEWRAFSSENRVYSVARDVTERRAAEVDSMESNQRFQAAFHASPAAVVIVRISDGQFVDVNAAASSIFGWSRDEAVGKTAAEIRLWVNPEDRAAILAEAAKNEGKVDDREVPLRCKDGRVIQASVSLRQIVVSGVPHVLFLTVDETERRQAEESLLRAQKLESVGLLAGGIAHDFNNLLSGVFGSVDLALDAVRSGDSAEAISSLEIAITAMDRARDLTRQLLTFSKGGAPIKRLGNLIETVRQTVLFALSGSSVRADFSAESGVWNCEYDPHQIEQVIDNLVINAKQAMPEGGTLRVHIENAALADGSPTGLAPGPYVRVTVADQGVGIATEQLPRVFEPFFSTKASGGGLGLATSWSIVKRHNGHIDLESEPGKGSVFTIWLPATGGVLPERDLAQSVIRTGRGRILVLDDEWYICQVAERMLALLGYSAESVHSGDEAVDRVLAAQALHTPFDAAILDLTIPGGIGGREVIGRIATSIPSFRAIASSGYADDPVMSEPTRFGFQASLSKPYRRRDVAEVLHKVLGSEAPRSSGRGDTTPSVDSQ